MEMATAKDELKTLLEQQPEDSSSEELVRELAFHVMIQRGLSDSDAGRTISNEEMIRRLLDAYTRAQDRHISNH
jgi:predicted transcriptional regulator